MVSIKGKSKAAVLAALYNHSKPQGIGYLHYNAAPMGEAQAASELSLGTYFDYLNGRVMKMDLKSDESFDERLYDRDLGTGAAQRAVDSVPVLEAK